MKLLFSFLALCSVAITTPKAPIRNLNVVPGGQNVGIEIKPGGLIVSGTYDVKDETTSYNPSRDSDINKGDIIYKANDIVVKSIDDFLNVFDKNAESSVVRLNLRRKGQYLKRNLKIVYVNGRYKTGLFVKERLLGIGTVSYYDEKTHIYGALGHEISDSSSNDVLEVDSGEIYESSVTNIKPSINSQPGEKIADISFNDTLGEVVANTPLGIFGKYEVLPPDSSSLPVAEISDIKLGPAEMWTVTQGQNVQKYQIEITNLKRQEQIATKGITFKVTDKRLLNISNGIVAGMSGSPIIQDGKVVGAVTHVIVDDVDNGYAVYMKWMFEVGQKVYQEYYQ